MEPEQKALWEKSQLKFETLEYYLNNQNCEKSLLLKKACQRSLMFLSQYADHELSIDDLPLYKEKLSFPSQDEIPVTLQAFNSYLNIAHYDFSHIEHADWRKIQSQITEEEYCGIGLSPERGEDGSIRVIALNPNGPAQKADIREGDIIFSANHIDLRPLSNEEIGPIFRGKCQSQLEVELLRQGEVKKILITRALIEEEAISTEQLDNNWAKIRIKDFRRFNLITQFRQKLSPLLKQGLKGLVIDLRHNPGGYVNNALNLASFFLPENELLITENRLAGTSKDFYSSRQYLHLINLPLIILMDSQTASAAEIFAGALAAHQRALLVGSQSFGKGTILKQERFPYLKKVELWKTYAFYSFKNKGTNHLNGILPHIAIRDGDEGERLQDISLSPLPIPSKFKKKMLFPLKRVTKKCLSQKQVSTIFPLNQLIATVSPCLLNKR